MSTFYHAHRQNHDPLHDHRQNRGTHHDYPENDYVQYQYIDEQKPWIKAKQPDEYKKVIGICSLGLNFFRLLVIYLKPVLPSLAEKVEAFLNIKPLIWEDTKSPLLDHTIEPFKSLMQRIESDQIEAIVTESLNQLPTADQ